MLPKNKKMGRARPDKISSPFKEHGYRSRAAFKLIQINKKYNFLDNASSLVDLCAAPGGWLQVAHKQMPPGSFIVGVDLQEIRPIDKDIITFTDDITLPSCIHSLTNYFNDSKVDVILHDGVPNNDEYSQAELTLKAINCAVLFLKKGGWFITKVFNSEDYQALLWVLSQLFRKIEATKPKASNSAEIYVVCEDFLAPTKIDPRLFDCHLVFQKDKILSSPNDSATKEESQESL